MVKEVEQDKVVSIVYFKCALPKSEKNAKCNFKAENTKWAT